MEKWEKLLMKTFMSPMENFIRQNIFPVNLELKKKSEKLDKDTVEADSWSNKPIIYLFIEE